MKYDFDEIIDRQGTNAMNTDGFRQYIFQASDELVFPYADSDFIRMWVADMDFAVAEPIVTALRDRLDHTVFGYGGPGPATLRDLIAADMLDLYG